MQTIKPTKKQQNEKDKRRYKGTKSTEKVDLSYHECFVNDAGSACTWEMGVYIYIYKQQ